MRGISGYGLYTFVLPRPDICAEAPQQLWVEVAPDNFAPGGVLEEMVLTSAATYFPQPALLPLPDCAYFDLDNISFGFNVAGSYAISALTTQPDPQRVGQPVNVSFRITNTGETWITALPLRGLYDPAYLAYRSASPPSDDTQNDGEITWQDLAGDTEAWAATAGPAASLPPGASLTVVMTFTALADTGLLPGSATTITATSAGTFADPDGPAGPLPALGPLPARQAAASATVYFPTGGALSECRAAAEEEGIRLTWQTASEAEILGFNVLYAGRGVAAGSGELEALNPELIIAEYAGIAQGARYTYLDRRGTTGENGGYVLEVVYLDGRIAQHRMPFVNAGEWR